LEPPLLRGAVPLDGFQVLRFQTTRWSIVNAVGAGDSAARSALAKLCETYWYPLYAYVRRRGVTREDARDLTQGFFAFLIERRDFDSLRKERGRFRAFLLASMQHYLANDFARRTTLKRGGGTLPISLEFDDAEGRYRFEPAAKETPQTLFERRWALTVLERALAEVRKEWEAASKTVEFEALKSCLLGGTPEGGYAAVARDISSSEGAVRVAVHRLRRKFQKRLREEIAETVADPSEVDDEIRYLLRALDT
jgi:RNA polymerase sigma factor (sigma-70 family)